MSNRVAPTTHVGVALALLVAVAAAAAAWLLFARAEDRARADDDRAVESAVEALQNGPGRVIASLRGADALPDADGRVAPERFASFARAVAPSPSQTIALADVVPAAERAAVEARLGRPFRDVTPSGAVRSARARASYVTVVAVWPVTTANRAVIGLDLASESARRDALALAASTRRTAVTSPLRLVTGRRGIIALQPLYAPDTRSGRPTGYVSLFFDLRVIDSVFARLRHDVRARVRVDGDPVYQTPAPPSDGETRSLLLGGRRWTVTADAGDHAPVAALAVLVAGLALAGLLALFARSRASFERRLVLASTAEREARERSELLERSARNLRQAATVHDVAATTVADLAAAGFDFAAVQVPHLERSVLLATTGPAGDDETHEWRARDAEAAGVEAMRTGDVVDVAITDDDRGDTDAPGRLGSLIAVPLRNADGDVTGALLAGLRDGDARESRLRQMVVGVAEQTGVAMERARLESIEREAREHTQVLQHLAARLSAGLVPAEITESTVGPLADAFGAHVALVATAVDDDTELVWLRRDSGVERRGRGPLPPWLSAVAATVASGQAIESHGRTQLAERVGDEAAERFRAEGIASLIVLPLPNGVGFVGVAFRGVRVLTASERELLETIRDELYGALERSRLFEAERDARLRAELLERNAAHLAASATLEQVATSTVADLEGSGFPDAAVHLLGAGSIRVVAATDAPPPIVAPDRLIGVDETLPAADAIRTGEAVEVRSRHELAHRYPDARGTAGEVEALLAVPLRVTDRRVIGALVVAAPNDGALTPARRKVIVGIVEQCGVALERAQLQAASELTAANARFLAELAKGLERSTTVRARAVRLTQLLIEERATFAAVHVAGDEGPTLVASSGSRPAELGDDEQWGHVLARAIATGRPVAPAASAQGLVVLPLHARGRSIGTITYRAAADGRWEPTISPALADEIAARAAVQIDNAFLYEQERDASHALQLGLLGGGPPEFDGVVVTAAYRAGTEALEVGGDWYDAFRLPSGTTAVVVGDVVGHGLEAAVAMGQLRGAVGALAQSSEPAELLDHLDAFVENVPAAATATLAFAELDAEGRLTYACAGHPPPLVVSPDGATRFLWDGRSAPLGSLLGTARSDATDHLAEGETLVLYTDGLVERRSETLDVGLERLAAAARLEWSSGEAMAESIGDALLRGTFQDDDVCVLTLHRRSTAPLFSRSFVASPAELAPLRRTLRAWLVRAGLDAESTHGVILAVSEAAANAVEHGYGSDGDGIVTVMARLEDGVVRLSVRDEGSWHEHRARNGRGRGLRIIEKVVDDVSIDRSDGGTVVRMSSAGSGARPA